MQQKNAKYANEIQSPVFSFNLADLFSLRTWSFQWGALPQTNAFTNLRLDIFKACQLGCLG